jgi:hypothetical protein
MLSGEWYTLDIQLFPDGRCGVAVDGSVVGITPPAMRGLDSVYVGILGNSVGTRMLVGRLEIDQGIRPGIDWAIGLPTENIVDSIGGSVER